MAEFGTTEFHYFIFHVGLFQTNSLNYVFVVHRLEAPVETERTRTVTNPAVKS